MAEPRRVAALAYGTQSVPKVDKIVGPGNIYVATAKRFVFGSVGLDMVAGPSEILVVCDGGTDPDWVAMDLFSQAEHDEEAQAILLAWDAQFLDAVHASMTRLLPEMERSEIIAKSLASRGALIRVADAEQAAEISNRIAPEHLELSVADPQAWLPKIRNAGAIFMGRHASEAWETIVQAPTMYCRHQPHHAFLRRWAFMTFRNEALLFTVQSKVLLTWVKSLQCWVVQNR